MSNTAENRAVPPVATPLSRRGPGRALPVALFLLFAAAWVGALLWHAPGWGLMDDAQNLEIARRIRTAPAPLAEYWRTVTWDLQHIGTFRPGYYLWIVAAYSLGAGRPLLVYLFIAALNLAVLAGWGLLACRLFHAPPELRPLAIFAYPLAFFFFTPLCNLFMYVSLQEKFILLFSLLAALAMIRFYRDGRAVDLLLALAALAAGLATKSTMVYLALAFALVGLADLLLLGLARRRSALALVVYAAAFTGFYLFISRHLGGYTARYGERLRPRLLAQQLLSAPAAVKLLCLLCLLALFWTLLRLRRERPAGASPLALFVPLGALSYIAVILPWGFPNYMLSPLAPFALLLVFPFALALWRRRPGAARRLGQAAAAALLLLQVTVIWPRAERMADARRLVEAMRPRVGPQAVFFVPPPYMETATALAYFSGARVKYLEEGVLPVRRLRGSASAYLVFGRDFPPLRMEGVRCSARVYANSTWQILSLQAAPGEQGPFRPPFAAGLFERVSRALR